MNENASLPDKSGNAGKGISGGPIRPFGIWLGMAGFVIIAVFCGAFSAWSAMVPLESAVIARGVFRVVSSVRTVQHLEGGIVDEIRVRDGDRVRAGDILVRLRPTVPMAQLKRAKAELYEARAAEARLVAERDSLDQISFSAELAGTAYARDAVSQQKSIFDSRRKLIKDRTAILERTIKGVEHAIKGLRGQIKANQRQITVVEDQLRDANLLREKGLTVRPRVLALEREKAQLEGEVSRLTAELGASQQRIEETRLRMVESKAVHTAEVVEELRKVRAKAYELEQRISAATDVMRRTEIRAPIDGVVMRQRIHTVGGVAAAGQPLMDIVPVDDDLIVMATIDPRDIDQVKPGQDVAIWLSPTHRRHNMALRGHVARVSADQIGDAIGGRRSFYLARIELEAEQSDSEVVNLQAGMSAEVIIQTGARTAWSYIASPIRRSIERALREQ